jgi:hypothetical protein
MPLPKKLFKPIPKNVVLVRGVKLYEDRMLGRHYIKVEGNWYIVKIED